jgi:serine/threonine protein kinase
VTNSNGNASQKNGPSSSAPAAFSKDDVVANRYRIVRPIGSGGTGEVYEALDTGLGVPVALKTLKPSVAGDAVQLERFRREIQSARKVTHANICRIFDMGVHSSGGRERFFLTMELLAGRSLAQRLETGDAFIPEEALPIIEQIAAGLQAAHVAGVVHRDLKPANVMLLAPPTGQFAPRTVITDFGIALSDEQGEIRLTQSGELVGTPEYMAPEQGDLGPARPTTDIYALGLIIYEMLSKQRPFGSGATPLETVLLRRRQPPRPLRDFVPDLDPVWEATINRCLERGPERRFHSAAAVVAALHGEEPDPSSSTPSTPEGGFFGRFTRKLR